jgi:hypothetical protein
MATYLSAELSGVNATANQTTAAVGYKPRASVYGGRLKRLRATFTLGSTAVTTSDVLSVGNLPAGSTFAYGVITASATMGASATLAIGTSGSTGKYRAAATFTSADTPTLFGTAATIGAADPGLSSEEAVIVTVGTASLPTSGTLVIDLYYSIAN